jgi:hypothetical protein
MGCRDGRDIAHPFEVRSNHSGSSSVAFSPDGARVLAGSADTTLKLWEAASGQLLHTFTGHSGTVSSVAFSRDGVRVLSGGADQALKLWDVASGQLLRTFQGHSSWVKSVAFSSNGARVLSSDSGGTFRLWNAATGQPLASMVGGRDGQWLTITPAGFFAASRRDPDMLAIVRKFDVTTIDQLHQSLFNPDLVREALAGDPYKEVARAGEALNLETVLNSGPAPLVAITTPTEGAAVTTDTITVAARTTDRGKGIGRIEWRVNGITAAVTSKPRGTGPEYIITQELALDAGDNVIEVVAYNASNLLASLAARATIKFTGAADHTKPKLHVLAIGINNYVDKGWIPPGENAPLLFKQLSLAVNDASTIADDLKKAAGSQYGDVNVTLLSDEQASRDGVERAVSRLASEILPRDTFIFFAAAHGISEKGRFYLIPQDYQSGPDSLTRKAISQDRLQEWFANRIRAKKALILLDTCESGALVAGHTRSRTDSPASEAAVGRLHEATGRPVLTAAALGQDAWEGIIAQTGDRHGVFTWALLDALRNADTNNDNFIDLGRVKTRT